MIQEFQEFDIRVGTYDLRLSRRKLHAISLVHSLAVSLLAFPDTGIFAGHRNQDLLHHRPSSRPLRSTSQELLLVPKSRLKTYGDRAFSVAAPTLGTNFHSN
ncbi:hypothetical protein QZH41_012233 [Actinostola sp. cb2023]|nr:hypothetical protein QZH41_012233 [Actinostola sp. cb2023]